MMLQLFADGIIIGSIIALGAIGAAQNRLGRFDDAVAALTPALAEARGTNVARFEEVRILVALAVAHLGKDDGQAALRTADEAVEVARRQGAGVVECLALCTRGRVRRTTGKPDEAAADLDAALALAAQTGALSYEPAIREELGRLRDDELELARALRLYRQLGAEHDAVRLERELAAGATG